MIAARVGLYGLAGTTAWARIEAEKHFPSDVLAGAALGNFFARFFYGAFVGFSSEPPLTVEASADRIAFRLIYPL